MKNRFIDYIRKEHLIAEGQRVLLAVSGGRDSVTMAHLFHSVGLSFAVAHCNFHLRPGDCDRDEQFVRQLANQYGVSCFVAQFQTADYASTHHLSVEEAAREQRYSFFEEVRQREGYDLIATAHHRDDSIETFFINLLRGTGIHGLCGIPPRRGNIVRPLLCFGRDEINAYVSENNLQYVEDYTNSQTLYLRNRIRLNLLPLLRELSPSFDSTMQGNIERFGETAAIFDAAIDSKRCRLLQKNAISIAALKAETSPETVLFELLKPFGFAGDTVAQIIASLDGQSGLRFYSSTHCLVKDRSSLVITQRNDSSVEESYELTAENFIFVFSQAGIVAGITSDISHCGKNEALFDYDCLKFPLRLRHWRHGDRFLPFGMNGSRLVSDLFTDLKLSLPEKERVWLLCDADGAILWVVGLRATALCPVTAKTCKVLRLTASKDSLVETGLL